VIDIGLSIVQGSGIGPPLYIVMKNDLCIVSAVNDRKAKTEGKEVKKSTTLECGPMPNVMVALSNIGGVLCSTPQSLADAHY